MGGFKMDLRDFRLDIPAIHLPCKVRTGLGGKKHDYNALCIITQKIIIVQYMKL